MDRPPAVPAERPANLTSLQRELADLAARSKPVPRIDPKSLAARFW